MPPVYEVFDFDISDDFNEHTTSTARGRYGLEKDGLAHATTDYLQRIYDFCKKYWEIGGLREARGYAIPLRFLRQAAEAKMNDAMFNLGENTGGQEASLDMGVISNLVTSAVATGLNSQKRELLEATKEALNEVMAVFLQEILPTNRQGVQQEGMEVDYGMSGVTIDLEPRTGPPNTSAPPAPKTTPGLTTQQQNPPTNKTQDRTVTGQQHYGIPKDLDFHLQALFQNPCAEFKSPYQRKLVELCCAREPYIIGILPTGGGKSLGFELPPSYESCKTVVLSPFISLLDDMVRRGKELHLPVKKWTSNSQGTDLDRLLYVALESYTSNSFRK